MIGPLLRRKERLVVAWRPGLWKMVLQRLGNTAGVVPAGNPHYSDLSGVQLATVQQYLKRSVASR